MLLCETEIHFHVLKQILSERFFTFEKDLTKAILLSVSAVGVLKCCFWSLCSLEWNRGFCTTASLDCVTVVHFRWRN